MAEWISVEDRLPDVGENVEIAIQMKGLLIDPDGAWLILGSGAVMRQVTHWRIPEPPKQEGLKAITIDIHINDKQIDIDDFADMVAIAVERVTRRA